MRIRAAALALLPALWPALAAAGGDAERGRLITESRTQGLCVLCHQLPGVNPVHGGTIGPPLAGIGSRLTPEQLRERLLHPERFNPQTVMPAYGRSDGLQRVAPARRGQPLLEPQQIDDVVAYLATLKDEPRTR